MLFVSCAQAPSRPEGRVHRDTRGRSAATSLDGAEHSSKIGSAMAAVMRDNWHSNRLEFLAARDGNHVNAKD
jgi:hypothetical protein